jgi:hypothetical protein
MTTHFSGHVRESGSRHYHAWIDLPENPLCWLLGHSPRVRLIDRSYGEPWLLQDCRWCERRWEATHHPKFAGDVDWKALVARRVETFRQIGPKQFAANMERRGAGWTTRQLELNAELHWRGLKGGLKRFRDHSGIRLHTGRRGSETPYDAHLNLGFAAGYFSIGGIGGRWAELIGRGHGRDLSLSLHGGQLWWKLWYDGDSGNDEHHRCDSWRRPLLPPWRWGRRKHRGWMCLRNGNIPLNPVDAFYGSTKWLLVSKGEPRTALVVIGQFPGDKYLVTFRLDRRDVRRDSGPAWAQRVQRRDHSVEWDAVLPGQPGIPYRNHDWKGDETCSGNLQASALAGWSPESGADWLPQAVATLRDNIVRDRERYDYRPPATFAKTVGELAP